MIRSLSDHQVHSPGSLAEALTFLHENRNASWTPLAGGTDALVPVYRDGRSVIVRWLDLRPLRKELRCIRETSEFFEIGAMTTVQDLLENRELAIRFPTIRIACYSFAGTQIRNRATVAGNLVNASPAADLPPIWLSLDAHVILSSVRGFRKIPLDMFWTGYKQNVLEPDELIVRLIIPKKVEIDSFRYFRKVAPRRSNSISLLNFAASGQQSSNGAWNNLRLAYGCVGPFPMRAKSTEALFEGRSFDESMTTEVIESLQKELKPISDHRATERYRSVVAINLTTAFLFGHMKSQVDAP